MIWSSVIDVCFLFTAIICACFCRTAVPIVIKGIFLPTRRIIIPIYKLIFCVKQFFEKYFRVAAVFPVCNIAIIGCIKIIDVTYVFGEYKTAEETEKAKSELIAWLHREVFGIYSMTKSKEEM